MRLKAIRDLTYSTRRLQAGDEFEASNKDARLLIAIRKAKRMRDPAPVPPPPPAVAEKIAAAVAPQAPVVLTTGVVTTGQMGTAPTPPKANVQPASRPVPATVPVAPKPPAPKPGG